MNPSLVAFAVLISGLLWTVVLFSAGQARQAVAQRATLAQFASRSAVVEEEKTDYWLIIGRRLVISRERDWIYTKLTSVSVTPEVRFGGLLRQKAQYFTIGGTAGIFLGLIGMPWIVALLIIVVALFYPNLSLYNEEHYRNLEIALRLPSVVDLLVLAVEAGMNVLGALGLVAEKEKGAISEEFMRVLQDIDFGHSRTAALSSLRERATEPSIRNFANALIQADSLGVSIGPVLREQSELLRRVRREQAREKAQKIPVKILFPIMLCFVPSLFLIVLGPVALSFFTGS